jgi:hypothetical protein
MDTEEDKNEGPFCICLSMWCHVSMPHQIYKCHQRGMDLSGTT